MTRSRIVALLRVILPLTALALLSVLFLLGRKPEPDATIPYADVDPREVAERQMATSPTYAGVTEDGAQINITGAQVMPGSAEGQGTASTVRMTFRAQDGRAALGKTPHDRGKLVRGHVVARDSVAHDGKPRVGLHHDGHAREFADAVHDGAQLSGPQGAVDP